jgi:hypothetical protein
MSHINWKERLVAAGIHFMITLIMAALTAALVFLVWFPGALAIMVGGASLFSIVVTSDVVLGPLISLVIYSSQKPRKQLIVDYTVIAVIQVLALAYGTWVVAASRPVFVAFHLDRLEVVTAVELSDADLRAGIKPEFKSKSWRGPRLVAVKRPIDKKESNDLLFSAMMGKDGYLLPKYYRNYNTAFEEISKKSKPLQDLFEGSGHERRRIEAEVRATKLAENDLGWLLVHHRFGFGIGLLDMRNGEPVRYIAIDPTWVKGGSQ